MVHFSSLILNILLDKQHVFELISEPVIPECAFNDPFPMNIDPTTALLCAIGLSPTCKQGSYQGDPQQVEQDIKIYCIKG